MDSELKARTRSLFKGVRVFISGGEWTFYNPIYPGDSIYIFMGEEKLQVDPSEFAGQNVVQIHRDVKFNRRGQVVAVYRMLKIPTERKAAAKRANTLI